MPALLPSPHRPARPLRRRLRLTSAALSVALVAGLGATGALPWLTSPSARPGPAGSGASGEVAPADGLDLVAAHRPLLRLRASSHHTAALQRVPVSVILKEGKRAVRGGRLVVKVDGRKVKAVALDSRNRQRRFKVSLPALRAGRHTTSAVYRLHGRRVAKASWLLTAHAGCAVRPGVCGYPDAGSTGVRRGIALRRVGSQTISRPGTVFQNAIVDGHIEVKADNVTIRNVRIVENGQTWGIGLRGTTNTRIDHVDIARGPNGPRLEVGIKDVYGNARGTRITNSDISGTSTGIQTHEGLVRGNYIHDLGYQSGDHLNGFTSNGSTKPLTIDHNTILNHHDQTDAISLFQDFGLEANRTVTNNLLAGGSYSLYAGGGSHGTSHHITISGNRFSRRYFPRSGVFGPVTAFDRHGTHNVWRNNVWDETGRAVRP